MEFTDELKRAWDFIENTDVSIFITGKPGTGKTTFLRYVLENTKKTAIVCAPTGVAAINARGVTLHSMFQLPLTVFSPDAGLPKDKFRVRKSKLKIVRALDLLIIDEISMVRADVMDSLDAMLRRMRRNEKPFGGVQLLMFGDLAQLPPVVRRNEEEIIARFYASPFFYSSRALQTIPFITLQLTQVFRQRDDAEFLSLLDHLRSNSMTADDFNLLNSRFVPDFDKEGYIRLTSHNYIADSFNQSKLDALPGKITSYSAILNGDFPENSFPVDGVLALKPGAQVMFTRNNAQKNYYNGKIGRVVSLDESVIKLDCDGVTISVERETWENIVYTIDEETKQVDQEVKGTFTQFPLRLAWAITIHKSQGLTLDRMIVDAAASFASGQVYVALSRARSLSGLVLASPIPPSAVKVDYGVKQYLDAQESFARDSLTKFDMLAHQYALRLLVDLFSFSDLSAPISQIWRFTSEQMGKAIAAESVWFEKHIDEFRVDVVDVAEKWRRSLQSLSRDRLADEAFLTRLRNSCSYFLKKLDSLHDAFVKISKTKTANRDLAERFKETCDFCRDEFKRKSDLLSFFAENDFNVPAYLRRRQQILLGDLPSDVAKPSLDRKSLPKPLKIVKEKKLVPPKESTASVSLKLYKRGLSIAAIANERNLTEETIIRHLLSDIKNNDPNLLSDISKSKRKSIAKALAKVAEQEQVDLPKAPLGLAKALLGDDISYTDIKIVRAYIAAGII